MVAAVANRPYSEPYIIWYWYSPTTERQLTFDSTLWVLFYNSQRSTWNHQEMSMLCLFGAPEWHEGGLLEITKKVSKFQLSCLCRAQLCLYEWKAQLECWTWEMFFCRSCKQNSRKTLTYLTLTHFQIWPFLHFANQNDDLVEVAAFFNKVHTNTWKLSFLTPGW